jgi:hypothetical protein
MYAEAFALHALELDHDEGKDNVIFALDYLLLVQWLNSLGIDKSSIGLVVYLASNIS